MSATLKAAFKYFAFFCLAYGTLTGISLVPRVGAVLNTLYRKPAESLLQGIFPKAYLRLKPEAGNPDVILVEYASRQKIQELQREARLTGKPLQAPGKISPIRFYNMFLSFYLFFAALMLLSPIKPKEKATGLIIGAILLFLFTVFRISLSLLVLFNEPDTAIYQTPEAFLAICRNMLFFLTLGAKVLFVLALWILLAFRKQNWRELLQR